MAQRARAKLGGRWWCALPNQVCTAKNFIKSEPERFGGAEKKWQFGDYNRADPSAHSHPNGAVWAAEQQHPFLKDSTRPEVSYRQNRLTMFKSTLLHASDGAQTFRSGYKHRRINFTLLFGRSSAAQDDWGGLGAAPQIEAGSPRRLV